MHFLVEAFSFLLYVHNFKNQLPGSVSQVCLRTPSSLGRMKSFLSPVFVFVNIVHVVVISLSQYWGAHGRYIYFWQKFCSVKSPLWISCFVINASLALRRGYKHSSYQDCCMNSIWIHFLYLISTQIDFICFCQILLKDVFRCVVRWSENEIGSSPLCFEQFSPFTTCVKYFSKEGFFASENVVLKVCIHKLVRMPLHINLCKVAMEGLGVCSMILDPPLCYQMSRVRFWAPLTVTLCTHVLSLWTC